MSWRGFKTIKCMNEDSSFYMKSHLSLSNASDLISDKWKFSTDVPHWIVFEPDKDNENMVYVTEVWQSDMTGYEEFLDELSDGTYGSINIDKISIFYEPCRVTSCGEGCPTFEIIDQDLYDADVGCGCAWEYTQYDIDDWKKYYKGGIAV